MSRYPDPLSLGTKNKIGEDLNVVSAMVDIITSDWGGANQPLSNIDVANFQAAANAAYDQGNGCSLVSSREVTANNLLEPLNNQLNSIIFVNPKNNKYQIKVVEFPLNKTGALRIYDNDIISISKLDKPSWETLSSNLSLTYTDRKLDYTTVPVLIKNLSIDNTNNSNNAVAIPTITNKELATKILAKIAVVQSSPTQAITITTNRKTADAMPGDTIVLTYSPYKYYSVAFLVKRRRTQPLSDNTVTLEGIVYLYSNNNLLYSPPEDSFLTSYDPNPYSPTELLFFDLPYEVNIQFMSYVGYFRSTESFIGNPDVPGTYNYARYAAKAYNKNQLNFGVILSGTVDSNFPTLENFPFPYENTSYFLPGCLYETQGTLREAIGKYDSWSGEPITVEIDVTQYKALEAATQGIIIIGDEIFEFDTANWGSTWTYTSGNRRLVIGNCYRSMMDSVTADHAVGDRVFVFLNYAGVLYPLYGNAMHYPIADGDHLQRNYLVYSSVNQFGKTVTSIANPLIKLVNDYTGTDRHICPYRPTMTKIDGSRSSSPVALTIGSGATISWIPRPRFMAYAFSSGDNIGRRQLVQHLRFNEDATTFYNSTYGRGQDGYPEKYRVWIEDVNGDVYDCGLASPINETTPANSKTITIPAAAEGFGSLWVEAEFNQFNPGVTANNSSDWAVRKSKYKDKLPIEIVSA